MPLRLLNVRNPAAAALILTNGKDIENRSYPFPFQRAGEPEWVGIVASGNTSTDAERTYITTRLEASGFGPCDILRFWAHNNHFRQTLIGAIEIVANTTTSRSVWYNGGPDIGWVVGRRIRLSTPVVGIRGTQCLRYLHSYPDTRKRREMQRALSVMGIVPRPRRRHISVSDDEEERVPGSIPSRLV